MATLTCISPVDDSVYLERPYADFVDLQGVLDQARRAFQAWSRGALADRVAVVEGAADWFETRTDSLAEELTWQTGRPIRETPGEIRALAARLRALAALAPRALRDEEAGPDPNGRRFARAEPLGVVAVVAPAAQPYLSAANAAIPALLAGNAVVLKPSSQVPLSAERFAEAFAAAGLPAGVFQPINLDHATAALMLKDTRVARLSFTGTVGGGRTLKRAMADRFAGVDLMLAAKNAAYVRAEADLDHAVRSLVDGAFLNAGQSCGSIERIYVQEDVHEAFVEAFRAAASALVLDNPLRPETTLGPMLRKAQADATRLRVVEALDQGARPLIDPRVFARDRVGSAYCAPQALTGVTPAMRLMREECFGPVVGIDTVKDDDTAVRRINDSRYGFGAAIFGADETAALALGERLAVGTVTLNRCDASDAGLPRSGVKDSGEGAVLGARGFAAFTRAKSFLLFPDAGR